MDYEKTTEGIRVVVRPSFSLPHSEPADGKFVFTYVVQMENQSAEAAQLLFRHWHIHDSEGEDSEVEGEGVLGEQPSLAPGKSHVYQSFCVLQSPVGFMEGTQFTYQARFADTRLATEEHGLPGSRFGLLPSLSEKPGFELAADQGREATPDHHLKTTARRPFPCDPREGDGEGHPF